MRRSWILLPLLLIAVLLSWVPDGEARQVDVTPYIQVLEDRTGNLRFVDVTSAEYAARFTPAPAGGLNYGYSHSAFWLRIRLDSHLLDASRGLLEVGYFTLEQVEFYAPGEAPIVAGRHHPGAAGAWPYRHTVFPVTLSPQGDEFYMRVKSSGSLTMPLVLWDQEEFDSHGQRLYLGLGLYYGALAALAIYNLLLFVSLRERTYLLYSTFAACLGLGIVSGNGIGHQFLWPQWSTWSTLFSTFAIALAVIFAILFSQAFLDTRRHTPRLHQIMWLLLLVFVIIAAAPFIGIEPRVAEEALAIFGIGAALVIVSASVIALRKGQRSARFYLLAWGILWTGATVAGMRNFGWLPTNDLTAYAIQLSSAVEMVLLSFALADRIHLERAAKERAQAEAIAAKEAVVEALQSSEQRLEATVRERTGQLDQALKSEQRMLEQYVRFGALISHEFRNPLAIIKSQTTLMQKEWTRGIDNAGRRLLSIRSATTRLELLFEEWLQSDRLKRSSAEARPEPILLAEWMGALLDECVSCYADHWFDLRLEGDARRLTADESMLRVAVHNLVDNAAKYSPPGTTITVETCRREGMIGIAVSDQGVGISDADRERIYREYFRVNPEGAVKGFGLGLAFVHQIVQLHGGEIELRSDAGAGSRFCLWFPDVSRTAAAAEGAA